MFEANCSKQMDQCKKMIFHCLGAHGFSCKEQSTSSDDVNVHIFLQSLLFAPPLLAKGPVTCTFTLFFVLMTSIISMTTEGERYLCQLEY